MNKPLQPSFDRELRATELAKRGHATVDEILKTSFGEWPPKGLNIVAKNDQPVKIISMLEARKEFWQRRPEMKKLLFSQQIKEIKRNYYSSLGLSSRRAREIALPTSLESTKSLGSVLGHEVVHALQHDHEGGSDLFRSVFKTKHFSQFYDGYHKGADIYSGEGTRHLLNDAEKTFKAHEQKKHWHSNEIVEIQAHLHQVLAKGYQKWGKLPLNSVELVQGLKNAGLHMPDTVATENETAVKKTPTARSFASVDLESLSAEGRARRSLNHAYGNLSPQGQTLFWTEIIPKTYADLIELYGDREGRSRMGMGENPWVEAKLDRKAQSSSLPLGNSTFMQEKLAYKTSAFFGIGFGLKGIYDKIGGVDSTYAEDIQANGMRKTAARVGLVADSYMVTAALASFGHDYAQVLSPKMIHPVQNTLLRRAVGKTAGFLGRTAAPETKVGTAVTGVAALADFFAAAEAGDGHRIAQNLGNYIGSTAGSIFGSAAAGRLIPRFAPRSGKALTPVFGLMIGAASSFAGAVLGAALTDKAVGNYLHDYMAPQRRLGILKRSG